MPDALENPVAKATFLEFFELTRPPFARLAGPSAIYHAEQYSLLMSHLANATRESDCLVVLRGVDGCGKTTLLNRYLSGLDEDASFATIDHNCAGATEFYSTLLQQIGFDDLTGTLEELRRITREFLVHRARAGDTVLVVFDNAHLVRPAVLEQLRWITEIKLKGRRVVSIVMAGNANLARVIDSPALQDVRFRSHVRYHIRAYTEEETADYIRYRLMLAGGENSVTFAAEAQSLIYRFTGGIPRCINRVCISLLTEACARERRSIDETLVRIVADAEQLPINFIPRLGRGRRKTDPDYTPTPATDEEIIQLRESTPSRADRALADKIIAELRATLAAQTAEADKLARTAIENAKAIDQLQTELKEQKRATRNARARARRAGSRVDKLEEMKSRLQETTKDLRADLRKEKKKAKKLAALEQRLESSEEERAQLEQAAADLAMLRQSIDEKDAHIATLKAELVSCSASSTETMVQLADFASGIHSLLAADPRESGDPDARITALEVSRDGEIEEIYEIDDDQSRIMIGRGSDSDLRLESGFVSRHHALIFCGEEQAYVEDLHSFNGTIVNDSKVTRCDLRPNDIIYVGDFRIRLLAEA